MINQAKQIFESIRDIPYRLPEFMGDEAPQCAYKSYRLIKELLSIGYQCRAKIAEMDWSQTRFPLDIISLYPSDILPTHMYVEIFENNVRRPLDASWDIGLAQAGFPIAEFNGTNSPGLPLVRVFTLAEQEEYLEGWNDQARIADYFERAIPFHKAVNEWLALVRK